MKQLNVTYNAQHFYLCNDFFNSERSIILENNSSFNTFIYNNLLWVPNNKQ